MWKVTVAILVTVSVSLPEARSEFLCYSCQMDGAATDKACMKNPAAVTTSYPTVKCPEKYCIIIRQEYLDPPGQIYTFHRGCSPYGSESVIDGGGFRVYTRTCRSNLCNDWDGIASKGGGGGSGGSGGSSGSGGGTLSGDPEYQGVIRVPGTGGAEGLHVPIILIASCLAMRLLLLPSV